MKKLQWICLGCICVGVALLSVGLIAGACEEQTVENTYNVAEDFSKISVSGGLGNVTVAQATDGVSKVVAVKRRICAIPLPLRRVY